MGKRSADERKSPCAGSPRFDFNTRRLQNREALLAIVREVLSSMSAQALASGADFDTFAFLAART